ncbi:hypothetical protein MPH_07327 [Macrophomina phaseolina MS6]|uniref:Uncharacterized protein n=1 Tax=Macrophomina phaseolina (strain MS6) TaxID=1126212 RepID=K2QZL8_MACPH|nr:hypothetical protein MPH_07327 [Macrophomina phaseolina MS6]
MGGFFFSLLNIRNERRPQCNTMLMSQQTYYPQCNATLVATIRSSSQPAAPPCVLLRYTSTAPTTVTRRLVLNRKPPARIRDWTARQGLRKRQPRHTHGAHPTVAFANLHIPLPSMPGSHGPFDRGVFTSASVEKQRQPSCGILKSRTSHPPPPPPDAKARTAGEPFSQTRRAHLRQAEQKPRRPV